MVVSARQPMRPKETPNRTKLRTQRVRLDRAKPRSEPFVRLVAGIDLQHFNPPTLQHINMIEVRAAGLSADLESVRQLFREYAQSLEIDLCFQNFEEELASLPGKYEPPLGRLLLAWDSEEILGCVALRPVNREICEMKRLYVRPKARAHFLGGRLAQRICDEARDAGYRRICLDTLPVMTRAIHLYESLGFKPVEPYVFNPVPGAIFLGLELG